jgi:aconitate hydratase
VFEYAGPGLRSLSVPERATITNMGAELGATTSVFPSDAVTESFLRAQSRTTDWEPLQADDDAAYDEEIHIDLDALEPLAAQPHSPDNVAPAGEIGKKKVDQVIIGSCTNSSLLDLMKVAAIVKDKTAHPDVSFVIAPGSRQVLTMLSEKGGLADLVKAGARILECACGPCIGMGQSPRTEGVSLRTFNRNFKGRSGTPSADVYLVSPETAAVSALTGVLTDPREAGAFPQISLPERFTIDDSMIIPPAEPGEPVEVIRGPNIKPFPMNSPLQDRVAGTILIKLEDNITTDHIMPSYAKLLPFRSNIPYLADYCLAPCDPSFSGRAKQEGGGMILGGDNYGQGSSREHAALAPLQLGIKAVIAKSFARIHMDNLVNNGIMPLVLKNPDDYSRLEKGDVCAIENAREQVAGGADIHITNTSKKVTMSASLDVSERQRSMILAGGLLNYIKQSR